MERFHELLELFPEKIRPCIMNIAERHSMYGTKVEAQIIYQETFVAGELVEIMPEEEDKFSWAFRQRGYGMEVPIEYLNDIADGGKLIQRGEKHVG